MDQRWLLSRRALLGGVGAAGICSLLPRSLARAATATPTRLVIVHVPEGMWNNAQRPAATGTTFGPIFEPLDPFRSQTLVLNNLSMQSRDHGPGGDGHHRGVPHMLTGIEMADESNAGGASIDQKIATSIGTGSKFGSLQFAVRIVYNDTNSRPLWSAPKRVVPALQDPWDAYKRIFTGVMPTTTAGTTGTTTTTATPPAASKIDLRRSAMDFALAETTALRTRLSASDRERLDSYQESLRDIERRLSTTMVSVPGSCTPPTLGATIDKAAEANYPKIGKLQMDLMVAALQCNLTRVATLQWGNSNDQCSYSWLGVNSLGHDLAHNNGNCDPSGSKKQQVFHWYAEQFAYLLGKLQSVPEGTGTMLDNTVVLWVSEFGESNGHVSDKLLWLLMGNANGYFRQGRVLNCNGRSVNDLHTSLGNAFGLTDMTFGNPAYCAGPLADLR
jgi:hypothetical protein